VPLLVQLVGSARLPVQKATIGLLRNLALSEVSQDVIRKENVINLLGGMLHDLQNELVEAGSRMVDGVSLEEIVEGVLGTLHILARFPSNHRLINRANVVPTTIKVLNRMNNQNIQRAAVGLLCEVAVDPDIASQIDGENGAMRQLANLLHCRSEAVATYAASTMHRLAEKKSDDERKRVSVNLQKSLFQNEDGYQTMRSEYRSTMKSELASQDVTRNYADYNNSNIHDHARLDHNQQLQFNAQFGNEEDNLISGPGSPNFQDTDL